MMWMYLILGAAAGSGGSLSSLCSVYTAWTVCGSSTVLILLHNALSKLRSCQPTKELQAIKCRRMRIITSLLYSGESPVPRSCLPSRLSAPRLVESIKKMICSAHREKNHSHESPEKCQSNHRSRHEIMFFLSRLLFYILHKMEERVNNPNPQNESLFYKYLKNDAAIKAHQ